MTLRTCERCYCSYSSYNDKKDNDLLEEWDEVYRDKLEIKGLCQFCNPKSEFYLGDYGIVEPKKSILIRIYNKIINILYGRNKKHDK
jgi:hypothetical protein